MQRNDTKSTRLNAWKNVPHESIRRVLMAISTCTYRCKYWEFRGKWLGYLACISLLVSRFFTFSPFLQQVLGYLYGVECCALLYLVADEPEGDAVGVGEVLADAAHEDIVAVLVEEGHGVGEDPLPNPFPLYGEGVFF